VSGTPMPDAVARARGSWLAWPFWNAKERRLRAFCRIAIEAAALIACFFLIVDFLADPLTNSHHHGGFLAALDATSFDHVMNMVVAVPMVALGLLTIWAAGRFLDRRPFADFRARMDGRWRSGLALGLCTGAIVMTLIFVFEYAAGYAEVTGFLVRNDTSLIGIALLFVAVKALSVGIIEEFVSRGYLLVNLADAFGTPAAVVLSSLAFGAAHFTNDNASVLSALGIAFIATMFAVAAIATGRLSTAIGLHISWNLFEGSVFGFPDSGNKEALSLMAVRQHGPDLITGGNFGPEAGLVSIVASLAGIAIVLLWVRRQRARRSGSET